MSEAKIPIYQVDAFTNRIFGGNPAAICPLKQWLPDAVMQNIATENNLSETAFFIFPNRFQHCPKFGACKNLSPLYEGF